MDRILAAHLRAAADVAGAEVAALFVVSAGGRLDLEAQRDVQQAALDAAHLAWSTQERSLRQGVTVRIGASVVWPIVLGRDLVAVVYFDRAHVGFPDEHERLHARVIAARVRETAQPRPLGPRVAEAAGPDDGRRQLEIVLRHVAGNVAAAARAIGVNRDTIYERAARLSIRIEDFRPARRRRT